MVDIASVVNKLSGSLLIASQGYPNSDWVQTKGNVLEFLALTQGREGGGFRCTRSDKAQIRTNWEDQNAPLQGWNQMQDSPTVQNVTIKALGFFSALNRSNCHLRADPDHVCQWNWYNSLHDIKIALFINPQKSWVLSFTQVTKKPLTRKNCSYRTIIYSETQTGLCIYYTPWTPEKGICCISSVVRKSSQGS